MLRQKGAFSSFIIRLAIASTAISVMTMIMAVAFVTGFKYEVREKLFSFWGHIHIEPRTMNNNSIITSDPTNRDPAMEQKILHTPHVVSLTPFAVKPAIINSRQAIEGIALKGVTKDYHLPAGVDFTGRQINFDDSDYAKEIILSEVTAQRLEVKPGDDLKIYFVESSSTLPRIRKVKVAGIYHTGMEEVDKAYALCDLRLLQRINNWQPNQINGYQISIDNEKLADTLSWQIFDNYLQPPLTTYTMMDIFPNLFDWLNLQDVTTNVFISIMAIVAIINLAVVLLILIVEQVRMVGILKAQGMTMRSMQKIFLYHAGLIAIAGVVIGDLLAFGLCWLQKTTGFMKLSEASYSLKYVPIKLHWWQPLIVNLATIVLCILCMWLPSLYIRRIQPARVLQFK
ncbi:MAG: ABC transporter permease [Bacteroidetes bacterium]|nr:ABC transporter permease [Bacteroidota bacterium]